MSAGNEMRPLVPAEIEQATDVMARAFCDDPAWAYVVRDTRQRARILTKLFRSFVALQLRNGQVYGAGEPLQGVAIWSVPGQRQPSPLAYLRLASRLLFDPTVWGPGKRAMHIFRATEALRADGIHEPHFYLESLSVAPEAQGQGQASKLVRPFLAQADAQSVSVYLDTFKRSNVRIYEHYGFACREHRELTALGLEAWLLERPARSPKL